MTSSVAPDDNDIINEEMKLRQWESDNIGSDSLSSFLHHEEELSLESPARTGSDRSGVDGSGLLLDKDQVLLTTGEYELKMHFENCTRVCGSIEIFYVLGLSRGFFLRGNFYRQPEIKLLIPCVV